jgi:hypothetical protein
LKIAPVSAKVCAYESEGVTAPINDEKERKANEH